MQIHWSFSWLVSESSTTCHSVSDCMATRVLATCPLSSWQSFAREKTKECAGQNQHDVVASRTSMRNGSSFSNTAPVLRFRDSRMPVAANTACTQSQTCLAHAAVAIKTSQQSHGWCRFMLSRPSKCQFQFERNGNW